MMTSRPTSRDSRDNDPEQEFVLRELGKLNIDAESYLDGWRSSGARVFVEYLIEKGLLLPTARQLMKMMVLGYATIPFEQLVSPSVLAAPRIGGGSSVERSDMSLVSPGTTVLANDAIPPRLSPEASSRIDRVAAAGKKKRRRSRITLHAPSQHVDGTADELLDSTLDHYRIDKALGEGASSFVYRAFDEVENRYVTLKVLRPSAVLRQPALMDAFDKEAEILREVDHPSILRGIGSGRDRGFSYIVCEYFAPLSLESMVEMMGGLPSENVASIGHQVATAMAYLGDARIAHRDLSPQNILVFSSDCGIRICDFGAAHFVVGEDENQESIHYGNPAYMAPETVLDDTPDPSVADMYGLGATLYFAVAGRPPFVGDSALDLLQCHINDVPPALSSLTDGVDPVLEHWVHQLLAKKPSDRFTSWREIAILFGGER